MYFCIWIFMSDTKHIALVLGSSGLIGFETVNLLLNNSNYSAVYAVSRTKLPISHSKLIQILADVDTIEDRIKDITVDHLYSCIGTTASKTPDKIEYYKIDLDYPILVAKTLHNKGCQTICLISSMGASSTSKNFYLKLKGDVEKAIKEIGYQSVNILRPSLLLGKRKEYRLMERLAQKIFPIANLFLIGSLKDYRSIKATDIASAMINISLANKKGTHIYQTQFIKELA